MKKNIFKLIISSFIIANIILFTDRITLSAYNTLMLWFNTVIPSLFPFMIISSWLDFNISISDSTADKICIRLFGIPSSLMLVFVIGLISGYPMGAKITAELYRRKQISKTTAQQLLSFCNNCGIVFIISAVATSMLKDRQAAVFFISVTAFSSLLTGFIHNLIFPQDNVKTVSQKTVLSHTSFNSAISSAIGTIMTVGGCMIFFSVISESVFSLLPIKSDISKAFISGIFEFTRGANLISLLDCSNKLKYSLIACILSWGGISVHLQTAAVASVLNIPKYIFCKALSAVTAFITAQALYDGFFAKETVTVSTITAQPAVVCSWALSTALCVLLLITNKAFKHTKMG